MDRETPRSVMFDDLRKFGGITNRDTAWMLLRSTPMAGGKAPRDRVDERTFLSREVVHAPVERPRPELFADITQTAQNITARLISNLGGSEMARAMVAEHYSGEAADAMRESLSAYGLDDRIYRNACDRIAAPGTTAADCALPLVTLFVACGCLCDPQAAVQVTETLIADKMGGHFSTTELSVGEGFTARHGHRCHHRCRPRCLAPTCTRFCQGRLLVRAGSGFHQRHRAHLGRGYVPARGRAAAPYTQTRRRIPARSPVAQRHYLFGCHDPFFGYETRNLALCPAPYVAYRAQRLFGKKRCARARDTTR